MATGRITRAKAVVRDRTLHAVLTIGMEDASKTEAELPKREIAALLPRSIILGDSRECDKAAFAAATGMLKRLTVGRFVRVWEYGGRNYCSFLPWTSVTFIPGAPSAGSKEKNTTRASGSRKKQKRSVKT